MRDFKVGDKVVYIGVDLHKDYYVGILVVKEYLGHLCVYRNRNTDMNSFLWVSHSEFKHYPIVTRERVTVCLP